MPFMSWNYCLDSDDQNFHGREFVPQSAVAAGESAGYAGINIMEFPHHPI